MRLVPSLLAARTLLLVHADSDSATVFWTGDLTLCKSAEFHLNGVHSQIQMRGYLSSRFGERVRVLVVQIPGTLTRSSGQVTGNGSYSIDYLIPSKHYTILCVLGFHGQSLRP